MEDNEKRIEHCWLHKERCTVCTLNMMMRKKENNIKEC
jgi:hypothetical protein